MPVNIIDTLKPKNGLDFPVVEAVDVAVEGYTSLADAVTHFATDTAIAAINAALGTKTDASAFETATSNLQGQIDQIVISASAEAVVAPEVAAARVGADGTSYQTLKARLDAENTHLSDELALINSNILGLIEYENPSWISGVYTIGDGTYESNSKRRSTEHMLEVTNDNYITISIEEGYSFRWFQYATEDNTDSYTGKHSDFIKSAKINESGFYNISIKRDTDTTIDPSDNISISIKLMSDAGLLNTVDELVVSETQLQSDLVAAEENISDLNSEIYGFIGNVIITDWLRGGYSISNGTYSANTKRRSTEYMIEVPDGEYLDIQIQEGYSFRWFLYAEENNTGSYTGKCSEFITSATIAEKGFYNITIKNDEDTTIYPADNIDLTIKRMSKNGLVNIINELASTTNAAYLFSKKDISNVSIRAAKEKTYSDGTPPVVAWYLIEDTETQKFYRTIDFSSYEYMFTFSGSRKSFFYKFGITGNDDVVAVFRTESLTSLGHNDSVRENPYVFLASESYSIQHTVDFGNDLKPSGWLSSVGFRVLPNGRTLFCEYVRPSVETANCWLIDKNADITDKTSWIVTKSFVLSGDTHDGFKHCHAVMYDHYTGVTYLTTGDDNIGSQVWYSLDDGDTWTQAVLPNSEENEKYLRILNYTFLSDYVYWSTDTGDASLHYIFRAGRDANGVIDFNNITDLCLIPNVGNNQATYGTAYIPEYNMLLLVERCDAANALSMPVRAYMIDTDELITLGTLYTADGNGHYLGFRTEYTEYYPIDGKVVFGFGRKYGYGDYTNYIKGFKNTGNSESASSYANNVPIECVNNLYLKPINNGRSFTMVLGILAK